MGRPPRCLAVPQEGSSLPDVLMPVMQLPAPALSDTCLQSGALSFALRKDAEQGELSPDSWRL